MNGDVLASETGQNIGGHAMVITGWGTTTFAQPLGISAGSQYWWMRNSWGKEWGLNGYAKFKAGVNLFKVENRVAAPMMGQYQDFEPPICDIPQWSSKYNFFGS